MVDRRDPVLFAVLARNRRPAALRDLGTDFFTGCRLSALFETAVARLTVFRTGRPSAAALPASAPTTPPTTAPNGPATLPIAAPVTAPAVCFGIGGICISSDDGGFFFLSGFGWSGINAASSISSIRFKDISDDKVEIAVTKLKSGCETRSQWTTDCQVPETPSFSSAHTTKRFPSSRCASATKIVRASESRAETQPQLQPALLKLSAIITQYFTRGMLRVLATRAVHG